MELAAWMRKTHVVEHKKLMLLVAILGTMALIIQSCSLSYLSDVCSLFPDFKAHGDKTLQIGTSVSGGPPSVGTNYGGLSNFNEFGGFNGTFGETEETEILNIDVQTAEENEEKGPDSEEKPPVISIENATVISAQNMTLIRSSNKNISAASIGGGVPALNREKDQPSKIGNSYILESGLVITNETRQKHWMRSKIAENTYRVNWSGVPPRNMKPRWSSPRDRELISARTQIGNAPIVWRDEELYAPVFRNISTFKKQFPTSGVMYGTRRKTTRCSLSSKSYELMEKIFKVYIYKEGDKPIFHKPFFRGIYASEGWFMRHMEGSKRFVVRDPRKAHMFYLPYSSSMMREVLYVTNSHRIYPLAEFLKNYIDMLSRKYRFWNRTGGADHFLVACHDWGTFETKLHRELRKHPIKAVCTADLSQGFFKLGKDVSLPETNIRSGKFPLRDVGGKPASQRSTLAFFAGRMHGYLRPILLKHWENTDPDMKIYGAMPRDVASKNSYIQLMKSSKYCICPRGYEVNSPRIVEAIYYECVPVIISDNFVPAFFEILNWEAFSIIIPEKDTPQLKEILLSIPEQKYLELQTGVRRVQKHFLWHLKPVKYDLFHMILHAIWFNRLNQIKE